MKTKVVASPTYEAVSKPIYTSANRPVLFGHAGEPIAGVM